MCNFNLMIKRFLSCMIDVMLGTAFIVIPDIIGLKYPNETFELICFLLVVILVLFKDVFGRSLGKRLLKLHIIDVKTKKVPKTWKLMCRNLLLPLWIIDTFFCWGFKGQRIADKILNIEVVEEDRYKLL